MCQQFYYQYREISAIGMIIRTILKMARCFSDSKVSMMDGIPSDVAGMENISQLPFYLSFKHGLNLTLENRLEQANQHYQQSLNLLDDRKEQLREHYMHIYRKMTMNNFHLGKAKEVEANIYALIKLKKKFNVQSLLLYDDYDSLFQLFLRHNPEKAIVLGKALLSERQSQNLTLKHRKQFLFNLATAYFLVGNYPDAKRRYSECLESQPSSELKVKAYNNLALACWWAKNPLIQEEQVEPSKHRGSSVDSDFKQAKGLFLKAVEAAQSPESLFDEEAKYVLKQAIAEYELDLSAKFATREAVLPMYNLTQYYIHNQPTERVKILFWLRALLKLSQTHGSPLFDETYTTLCLLGNQREELAKFVPQMLKKYNGKIQEVYYCKIASFLRKEGKNEQAKQLAQRSAALEEKFRKEDALSFKRKFLSTFPFKI